MRVKTEHAHGLPLESHRLAHPLQEDFPVRRRNFFGSGMPVPPSPE